MHFLHNDESLFMWLPCELSHDMFITMILVDVQYVCSLTYVVPGVWMVIHSTYTIIILSYVCMYTKILVLGSSYNVVHILLLVYVHCYEFKAVFGIPYMLF